MIAGVVPVVRKLSDPFGSVGRDPGKYWGGILLGARFCGGFGLILEDSGILGQLRVEVWSGELSGIFGVVRISPQHILNAVVQRAARALYHEVGIANGWSLYGWNGRAARSTMW